jgi:hypothetical protein
MKTTHPLDAWEQAMAHYQDPEPSPATDGSAILGILWGMLLSLPAWLIFAWWLW